MNIFKYFNPNLFVSEYTQLLIKVKINLYYSLVNFTVTEHIHIHILSILLFQKIIPIHIQSQKIYSLHTAKYLLTYKNKIIYIILKCPKIVSGGKISIF